MIMKIAVPRGARFTELTSKRRALKNIFLRRFWSPWLLIGAFGMVSEQFVKSPGQDWSQ